MQMINGCGGKAESVTNYLGTRRTSAVRRRLDDQRLTKLRCMAVNRTTIGSNFSAVGTLLTAIGIESQRYRRAPHSDWNQILAL